jgi:hypothetical protein
MRTGAIAIEMYFVDHNDYPPERLDHDPLYPGMIEKAYSRLTTPIDYVSSMEVFADIFFDPLATGIYGIYYEGVFGRREHLPIMSVPCGPFRCRPGKSDNWYIESVGPNRKDDITPSGNYPTPWTPGWALYDPTNGTISRGNIIKTGGYLPAWLQPWIADN